MPLKIIKNIIKTPSFVCLLFIKAYKIILSPYFGNSCRFYPTCSSYSYESIKKFGMIIGIFLSVKRILKCNPLFKGGEDLVPQNINEIFCCNKNKK
jgi:putative membrane protein insertion efficiency factor